MTSVLTSCVSVERRLVRTLDDIFFHPFCAAPEVVGAAVLLGTSDISSVFALMHSVILAVPSRTSTAHVRKTALIA